MKLSTRGRYGMRAMMDLAMNDGDGAVLLKDIASRQGISLKYLEQLVTPLRAAGLIRGVRGAHGGYSLARPAKEIRLSEILYALEGSPAPVDCAEERFPCDLKSCTGCATQEIWQEMFHAIDQILENRTLQGLANRQAHLMREHAEALSYSI